LFMEQRHPRQPIRRAARFDRLISRARHVIANPRLSNYRG
jgi:hypothetical protein